MRRAEIIGRPPPRTGATGWVRTPWIEFVQSTGTAAPTPLKLTSAYAAVAADGVYAAPYTVTRITRDGRTVYSTHPERHRPTEALVPTVRPVGVQRVRVHQADTPEQPQARALGSDLGSRALGLPGLHVAPAPDHR